ncbi:hypothetical protein D3C85_1048530 [compost metagenome]
MTQVVAREAAIGIRRIFYPAQPMFVGIGLQLGTRALQQRPQQVAGTKRPALRHGRQPLHTGAAQQAKQQGLRLIVAMLRRQQNLAGSEPRTKSRITGPPRGALDTGARLHLHMLHLQRHSQRIAQATASRRPAIGNRLQAVMNMNGGKRRQRLALRETGQQMQQHG